MHITAARIRTLFIALLTSAGVLFGGMISATATPAQPATIAPASVAQAIVLPATTSSQLVCGTGGYAYETDSFYNSVKWDSYYRQYVHTVSWGGKRNVYSGGVYYNHKLESVRIKWNGNERLITSFATTNQTPEAYWLNSLPAQFTYTTRITNNSTGKVWYRACTTIR